MDYYKVLGLEPTCNYEQIAAAYRVLALEHHPGRHENRYAVHSKKFAEISEAYEVLSNADLRVIYDKFGKGGLVEGVPNRLGKCVHSYQFNGNVFEIFEKFFGDANPYTASLKDVSNPVGQYLGGVPFVEAPNDITVTMECTLYEFYNGCSKKLEYDREILQAD